LSVTSLDFSRCPLPQTMMRVGYFSVDCLQQSFFFPFYLSSLEIHDGHLQFQGSPLSCVYLNVNSHFFLFVIFILNPFINFLFLFNFILQSKSIIFISLILVSILLFLNFFLAHFINFQLFPISSLDKKKKKICYFF
jgi:hypothetical protein